MLVEVLEMSKDSLRMILLYYLVSFSLVLPHFLTDEQRKREHEEYKQREIIPKTLFLKNNVLYNETQCAKR